MRDIGPAFPKGVVGGVVLASLALAAVHAQEPILPSQPGPLAEERPIPAMASAPSPRADPVARWRPLIEEASRRFGVPTVWIERVMRAESGGRTSLNSRPIASAAGAMGLMQLMPATWAEMRARYGLGSDPFDPRDNILAGTAFLAELHARFGYPGLFGAYNAGPGRYADWLAGRHALPLETRLYLARVAPEGSPGDRLGSSRLAAALVSARSGRGRLFAIDEAPAGSVGEAETATADGLFVRLENGRRTLSEAR